MTTPDRVTMPRPDDEELAELARDGSFGGTLGIQEAGMVESMARECIAWRGVMRGQDTPTT
jgi:hypothetical protein